MAYEGKRSAGTKKKGKVTLILIIVVLVAALAAGAIWYFAGGATQAPEKIKNDQQETIIPEDDVITTDYMELAYPGMWTDRVEHEVTQEGADVSIVFRSVPEKIELFTLCFGTVPESGYVMGHLTDKAGEEIPVSVVMAAIEPDATMSEETLDELYGLQESINDLLVQLRENPDFTATN